LNRFLDNLPVKGRTNSMNRAGSQSFKSAK
jgi:hypothetical protein